MRRVLVPLALLALLGACSELSSGGHVSRRIAEQARNPDVSEVDIARLTTFGWDRMHIVKSGTPRAEVCALIGVERRHCDQRVREQSVAGESMTLAFSLKDRPTHVEIHVFDNGVFDVPPGVEVIARSAAVFRVRRSGSNEHPAIRLVQK